MDALAVDRLYAGFRLDGWQDDCGPVLLNSPHSGRVYPRSFLKQSVLCLADLRQSEDALVDELLSGAVGCGVPLMQALFPRSFVDLNREPYEFDPRLFEPPLPAFANIRSLRVAAGLGSIPRVAGPGQPIYGSFLPLDEGMRRIESYYLPYHLTLEKLMWQLRQRHGFAVLLDWHSMPSLCGKSRSPREADVVLGDRHGLSCSGVLMDVLEEAFLHFGYRVVRNHPYAGGFITEHYGRPYDGWHGVQIEINRGLYLDERALVPHSGFAELRLKLEKIVERVAMLSHLHVPGCSLAAE